MVRVIRTWVAYSLRVCLCLALLGPLGARGADDEPTLADPPEKYTLRFKFEPGELIRWRVDHRSHIRTTIQGTTKSAESSTTSVKAWRVTEVDDQGVVTFEHLVESIQMRQQNSGSSEISWDSTSDGEIPPVFEGAARSVGKVLAIIKMDAVGKVIDRKGKAGEASNVTDESRMSISLPKDPVAIGQSWSMPVDVSVGSRATGGVTKVRMRQKYTLEEVRHGIAIIHAETQILTPNLSPEIQSQVVQRESAGTVRFDIEAGRLVGQQYDCDKQVIGFSGDQSSLQCRTRFVEELAEETPATAEKPAETTTK